MSIVKLHTINTGYFKLDGGAMFGVVPKSIWQSLNPADDNNMCNWALRCLLVEYGNRLVLIDNGIGDKQDEKFFSHYYLHGNETLDSSLKEKGFSVDDITDVFLTHLHFDHCGGSIRRSKTGSTYEPVFKNATYWSNEDHWKWATIPNAREKASFLKENILPIRESGQLQFTTENTEVFPDVNVKFVHGHTGAMMIPHIRYKGKTVVYMADLLPSVGHLPVPFVMAYDTRPLITLDEKSQFLKTAVENDYILFFEHDPENECCSLVQTERGVRQKEMFRLDQL
ncbi:MAG: MBL fold metallo-hydrolase [Bacteroidetes bacterium]|nr:MBL fold metallo-hydrolase [Bacteroidota bacterium]